MPYHIFTIPYHTIPYHTVSRRHLSSANISLNDDEMIENESKEEAFIIDEVWQIMVLYCVAYSLHNYRLFISGWYSESFDIPMTMLKGSLREYCTH